jgi:hypothetical protein
VLADADIIVHAASHPLRLRRVDLGGTRRIIRLLQDGGRSPHVIYVSIVRCDRNPDSYTGQSMPARSCCARAGFRSPLCASPSSTTSSAPWHELLVGRWHSASPTPHLEPCERRWIAQRTADITLGTPPDGYQRVTDLAGPDVITVPEAIRMVCDRDSRRVPSLINLPAVGGWLSAFAARTNLPGPDVRIGGKSFIEWLRE